MPRWSARPPPLVHVAWLGRTALCGAARAEPWVRHDDASSRGAATCSICVRAYWDHVEGRRPYVEVA